MGLPKDKVKPDFNFTFPSEKDYFSESVSTLGNLQVTDSAKSGSDYGIKDLEKTEPLTGKKSETGNGA